MRGANGSRMEKHFHAVGNRFHSGNDFTVEKRPILIFYVKFARDLYTKLYCAIYKFDKIFIHLKSQNFQRNVDNFGMCEVSSCS